MLRIAVCEDDALHAELIVRLLERYSNEREGLPLTTCCFKACTDLMKHLQSGQNFDILLLDILMSGMNGMEFAQKLRDMGDDTPLIFLTSSCDYALDAFKVSAAQYLVKPISHDDLFKALDKTVLRAITEQERCFIVSTPGQTVRVLCSSIVYVELAERRLMVHLNDSTTLRSMTIRKPFAQAVDALMQDSRFMSAHKSFVLNMEHIKKLTGNSFIMDDGAELPIPRYKYARAKATYFEWLSHRGIGLLGRQAK